jgi:hypothetical protein
MGAGAASERHRARRQRRTAAQQKQRPARSLPCAPRCRARSGSRRGAAPREFGACQAGQGSAQQRASFAPARGASCAARGPFVLRALLLPCAAQRGHAAPHPSRGVEGRSARAREAPPGGDAHHLRLSRSSLRPRRAAAARCRWQLQVENRRAAVEAADSGVRMGRARRSRLASRTSGCERAPSQQMGATPLSRSACSRRRDDPAGRLSRQPQLLHQRLRSAGCAPLFRHLDVSGTASSLLLPAGALRQL